MRAVIQRCGYASVNVEGKMVAEIGKGILALVGFGPQDTEKDIDYINEKGLDTIRKHAEDFIAKREAPAYIPNDGKQTPMRGHPVFIAQHATATCCRECIRKWHKMQPGRALSQVQQDYLVDVIMTWIQKELERQ